MCRLFLAGEFKERKGRENRSSLIYPQHVLFYYQVIFCKWVVQLSSLLSPEGWKRERWRSMGPARPLCALPVTGFLWLYSPSFCSFFDVSCLLSYPPFSQFLTDILNTVSPPYLQLLRRKCIIMFYISMEKSHQNWWELRLNVSEWVFSFFPWAALWLAVVLYLPPGVWSREGLVRLVCTASASSFQYLFWIPSISKQWVGAALPTGRLTLG